MKHISGKKRLFIFIFFLAALMVPLIIRLARIMVFSSPGDMGETPAAPVVERGPILDRNGQILAIQTKLKTVAAWLPWVDDPEHCAALLSGILDMEEDDIKEILTRESHNYVFIKRKVTPTESEQVQALIDKEKIPGILLDDEYARNYPHGKLLSHVTGFVDIDNYGLAGLELVFDEELSPPDIHTGEEKKIYGSQLFLTIDIHLQFMIRQIALQAYEDYRADSVMILMMDAKNGEILSYVSIPDYNPNEISTSTEEERKNLPVLFSYEPGSVFKIFSLAAIMDRGGITPESDFLCTGIYDDITDPIKCLGIHGHVTPSGIIKYSCNVGACYASESIDEMTFYKALRDFGFGQKTGISLPGETAGIFRPVQKWSERTKPSISFGQEISVSLIQMASAATVLTNNGTLLKPVIVKKILSPQGKVISEMKRTPARQVISSHTAWEMLKMMETATSEHGTARRARVDGVRISAKTGTAQVFDTKTGQYSETHYIPSILGIFPTDDPAYIVYIVIDNPRGENYYGSIVAAPLLKEIIENLLSMTGITSDEERIIKHPGNIELPLPHGFELGSVIPDLTGYPKRLLLSLFTLEEITVNIKGEGYVVRQDPPPGTPVVPGMKITLELE